MKPWANLIKGRLGDHCGWKTLQNSSQQEFSSFKLLEIYFYPGSPGSGRRNYFFNLCLFNEKSGRQYCGAPHTESGVQNSASKTWWRASTNACSPLANSACCHRTCIGQLKPMHGFHFRSHDWEEGCLANLPTRLLRFSTMLLNNYHWMLMFPFWFRKYSASNLCWQRLLLYAVLPCLCPVFISCPAYFGSSLPVHCKERGTQCIVFYITRSPA